MEGNGFELDIWKHTKVVLDDLHHCVSSVEDLLANPPWFVFFPIALVMIDCLVALCFMILIKKTGVREDVRPQMMSTRLSLRMTKGETEA